MMGPPNLFGYRQVGAVTVIRFSRRPLALPLRHMAHAHCRPGPLELPTLCLLSCRRLYCHLLRCRESFLEFSPQVIPISGITSGP